MARARFIKAVNISKLQSFKDLCKQVNRLKIGNAWQQDEELNWHKMSMPDGEKLTAALIIGSFIRPRSMHVTTCSLVWRDWDGIFRSKSDILAVLLECDDEQETVADLLAREGFRAVYSFNSTKPEDGVDPLDV